LGIIIWVVLPRVRELSITGRMFIQQGIVIPFLPFLPFCVWMIWHHLYGGSNTSGSALNFLPESMVLLLTIVLVAKGISGVRTSYS